MATTTDYGTDLDAVTDLPDPEALCTGERNAGNAIARRLLTGDGALEEIGDPAPYDSLDVRQFLGARTTGTSLAQTVGAQARQVLAQDVRALAVDASATFAGGALAVSATVQGAGGPFSLVLTVDGVTTTILRGDSR